jgi:hypothetical protein
LLLFVEVNLVLVEGFLSRLIGAANGGFGGGFSVVLLGWMDEQAVDGKGERGRSGEESPL